MTESTLDVTTVSLDDLRPYHRNPRNHERSKEHVKESIEQYGFRIPIVVDEDNVIVAGHGRFKAVQQLAGRLDDRINELRLDGRDDLADNLQVINNGKIFAIKDTDLGTQEISEFRIADNRITELSEWDDDLLEDELAKLDAEESEPPGFTEEELDDLVDDYELEVEDDLDDDSDEKDWMPDEGEFTGVEIICPDCLDSFQINEGMIDDEMAEMLTQTDPEKWEIADNGDVQKKESES